MAVGKHDGSSFVQESMSSDWPRRSREPVTSVLDTHRAQKKESKDHRLLGGRDRKPFLSGKDRTRRTAESMSKTTQSGQENRENSPATGECKA